MELFLVFERWCFALSDGTESEEWERLAGVGGLREEVLVGWLCFFLSRGDEGLSRIDRMKRTYGGPVV